MIVAIAGNAVEHGVGVVLAAKGEADLAISVVKNSVAQVAAFLYPRSCSSRCCSRPPHVRASRRLRRRAVPDTISIWQVTGDGEATPFEGAALVATYVVLARLHPVRMTADFGAAIRAAYATEGAAIDLGRGVHDGVLHRDAVVQVPLATMNRHGLVAGATGTGKTKTLQAWPSSSRPPACRCSSPTSRATCRAWPSRARRAVPPSSAWHDLGLAFAPTAFPVEFLALGGLGDGVPVRATVSDFGPQLLAKVLGANATQEASLALVFHYADGRACRCSTCSTCARC